MVRPFILALMVTLVLILVILRPVLVFADCSVPLNINFTSTGFLYTINIYTGNNLLTVNAGIGNTGRTFFITENEGVDLLFVNKTIYYVSPVPPFFYTAELTANWNYTIYPQNASKYLIILQSGSWLNITGSNDVCVLRSISMNLNLVPDLVHASPNWPTIIGFVLIFAILLILLLTMIRLMATLPIQRPSTNANLPLSIYYLGRGMRMVMLSNFISMFVTVALIISSISMGDPPPFMTLSTGMFNHMLINWLYMSLNGRLSMSPSFETGIIIYAIIDSAMINLSYALLIVAMVFMRRGFGKLGFINDNAWTGHRGSLLGILGLTFLIIAIPILILWSSPLIIYSFYAAEGIPLSIIPGVEGILGVIVVLSPLIIIGGIALLVGLAMTLLAIYRALTTYGPITKYLGLAIIMFAIGFSLNFINVMGISLGLIINAASTTYLYYLVMLTLNKTSGLSDIHALILSAETELRNAVGNVYPLDNLRKAFNYVVRAMALRDDLPEAQEAMRNGRWTNQLIMGAVMKLTNKVPAIRELWLRLNQTTEINTDEIINKIREIINELL